MRKGAEKNVMVEVNYRQGRDGTTLDTVVQDLDLCASMEFLLTVADVFLKSMDQGFSSHPKSSKPASTTTKDSGDFAKKSLFANWQSMFQVTDRKIGCKPL